MCGLNGCGEASDIPLPKVNPAQRRQFMAGLISLPLAVVLSDPLLAATAAAGTEEVTMALPDQPQVNGFVAYPEQKNAPAILLIHEWWGLNDQIKSVAKELAQQGYIALAIDLYGGESTTDAQRAMDLMKAVDPEQATEITQHWIEWLKKHSQGNGQVATIGWCFGGGWSLNASLASPVDATVIYYGNVEKTAAQLAALKGPVQGHFALQDDYINQEMVNGFVEQMKLADKPADIYWYDAAHAFANPTGGRYDQANAAQAWERTLAFFKENLG